MSDDADAYTIAVIGAGFTGIATTCNLLALANQVGAELNVLLIGDSTTFGGGLAYRVEDDNLVLNVPIGNMSAFADRPADFLDYCQRIDSALISGSFVSRRVYGQYLEHCLAQTRADAPTRLRQMQELVVDVLPLHDRLQLVFRSAQAIVVDRVVLAFGHQPPAALTRILGDAVPAGEAALHSDLNALHRVGDQQAVLILGSGHTAVDTLFRLTSMVPHRKVYMVSRHGFLPSGHRNAGEFVRLPDLKDEVERSVRKTLATEPKIRSVLRNLRDIAAAHTAKGGNWRDVINSLRSITPAIWRALPPAERRQFLRHVASYWDAVRHRLAPVATRRVVQLLERGRLEVIAGRIQKMEHVLIDQLCVTVALRGEKGTRSLDVGSVVNCTGPTYDIEKSPSVLLQKLSSAGRLKPDQHRLGILVDEQYRCSELPNLHYVGPMLRATDWEATAVPELRQHAFELAKLIVASLAQTRPEVRR